VAKNNQNMTGLFQISSNIEISIIDYKYEYQYKYKNFKKILFEVLILKSIELKIIIRRRKME
jgi:hypothetical protein